VPPERPPSAAPGEGVAEAADASDGSGPPAESSSQGSSQSGSQSGSELDQRIRAALAGGDVDEATTLALEAYGPELLGFLLALLRSPVDAGDAFSDASIDVWRGLPGFQWQSSLRTWLYVLTRRAAYRLNRDPRRRGERAVPFSAVSRVSKLAVALRNTTLPRLEAQADALAEIRRQLDPDDQVLLVLRVDREMAWRDIAEVLDQSAGQSAGEQGAEEHGAGAARLRKRFMRIKEQIREMAKKAGV
jgi:RNA polymerase sigma-70 factor, ECF subfamily